MTIPNPIPAAAVAEAQSYYEQGQYMQAWNTLAQAGDRYADNAAAVLGRNQDSADYFFQQMVQRYWDEVEPGAYESSKFNAVAGEHLGNYLNELKNGVYPDTQFIIDSYEKSLVDNGLDKNMAFDGGLARMLPGDTKLDSYWGVLLGMEANRISSSTTTNDLNIGIAGALIGNAMTGALWDVINSGRFTNFSASMLQRFGDGVLDYLKELANIPGFSNNTTTGEWVEYDGGYGAVSRVYEVSVAPDPWSWLSTPATVSVDPIDTAAVVDTSTSAAGSASGVSNSNYYDPGLMVDSGNSDTSTTDTSSTNTSGLACVTYGDVTSCEPNYYDDSYANYNSYASYYGCGYGYYGFTGNQSTVEKALGADIGYIAQQAINDNDFAASAAAIAGRQQAENAALQAALPSNSGGAVLEAAHWDHQLITWSLATSEGGSSDAFSHYLDARYEGDVQKAFATWAAASGLSFQEVADSQQSDIRIGFAAFDTANSGIAGYTSFNGVKGAIQSNAIIRVEDPDQLALLVDTDGQKIYSGTEAAFSQLLLHEIGHALGLGSNSDPYSVLYYQLNANNRTLDSTDITGIKSLYGPGRTEPPINNTPVDQLIQALSSFAPPSSSQTSLLASNDPIHNQPLLAVAR